MTPLGALLEREALAQGFVAAGAVDVDRFDLSDSVSRYDSWLSNGHAGDMAYLFRGRDRRADVRLVFPECQSVLAAVIPYPRIPRNDQGPASGPHYARYLEGPDYHLDLPARLERAMISVNTALSEEGRAPLKYKICVDTSAVLERAWAMAAGLGWIGKNSLLIHPTHGSYLFIATVLLDQTTDLGPRPIAELCGHCTKCLTGCPTRAFAAPKVLDSRRCASYLTLEKRGALELPDEVRSGIGTWIAGCDVCQEVCPFNLKPVKTELQTRKGSGEIRESATSVSEWRALLLETEAEYRARVAHSALKRVKPAQFRRNLAVALTQALLSLDPQKSARLAEELGSLIVAQASTESDPGVRGEFERLLTALKHVTRESEAHKAPPKPHPYPEN